MGLFGFIGPNDILLYGINIVVSIFIFQLGFMFFVQWLRERRRESRNNIILAYGLYFICFSVSYFLYTIFIYNHTHPISDFFFIFFNIIIFTLSNITKGIGAILLSIMLESTLQKVFKTRYLLTIILVGIASISPFFMFAPFYYQILDIFNVAFIALPVIFLVYFTTKTFSEVRRKLLVSLLGLIIVFLSLIPSSPRRIILIQAYFAAFAFVILLFSKFFTILGLSLLIFGLTGYSFFLETEWRENLISLYIVDKERHTSLYQKSFSESDVRHEEVFAGGITSIMAMLREFTESKKDVNVINVEDKLLLVEQGSKVITALIAKKNLQNAQYILKEITSKFEQMFGVYLDYRSSRELHGEVSDVFRPMDLFIKDLLKL